MDILIRMGIGELKKIIKKIMVGLSKGVGFKETIFISAKRFQFKSRGIGIMEKFFF